MDISEVLFIVGPRRLPSVQIRGFDIATRLGCPVYVNPRSPGEIPRSFRAFVCVKANVSQRFVERLSKRGVVIWDIIDLPPPISNVQVYLASTREAQKIYGSRGRVELIRHHHCNFEGVTPRLAHRRPGWVGLPHWRPDLTGIECDIHDAPDMTRSDVVAAHLKMGIGLNLRSRQPGFELHARLNSGIKLINCLGFGLPSISNSEAGYVEIGDGCTVFSQSDHDWKRLISFLQQEPGYYEMLARNTAERGKEFTIERTVEKYRALIRGL